MNIRTIAGKTFYILGLDYTGVSDAAFLAKQKCTLYGWDESPKKREKARKDLKLVAPDDMDWATIDCMIKNPETDENNSVVQQALAAGVELWSSLDLLQIAAPEATYIAVTGTSGKSTVISLMAHLLREAGHKVEVGGHMGRPALEMPKLGKGDIYVLEVSSYQLLEMESFRANIAVLLNISPEHLDRHKNMDAYLATKQKIFNNQLPEDLRVLSVDNYELEHMGIALGLNVPLRRIAVTGVGADISATADGHLLDYDTTPPRFIVNLKSITQLSGLHNWQNITCAWAGVKDFMTKDQFTQGLDSFPGVRHRFQRVLEHEKIVFINDSKATTGVAASRGLQNAKNTFWVAGGEPREDGIEPCLKHLKNVKGIYLIGEATPLFAKQLEGAKIKCPVHKCKTLKAAMKRAYKDAQNLVAGNRRKATVLLSPACNSFDQFDSFEHRGNVFINYAYQLADLPRPHQEEEEE